MEFSPSLGYIKDTGTPKGRGVYASRAIGAGEVVEVCPVIVLPFGFRQLSQPLRRYVFNWGALAKKPESQAIALGYGSMYNHANPANVRYEAVPELRCMRYIAARDIAADEELTINYNAASGDIASERDNWFDARGIKPWANED
jgi:SET domain-containing protein